MIKKCFPEIKFGSMHCLPCLHNKPDQTPQDKPLRKSSKSASDIASKLRGCDCIELEDGEGWPKAEDDDCKMLSTALRAGLSLPPPL